MKRSVAIHFAGEKLGQIRGDEWGVVFDPIDQRAEFDRLRLLTWETVEAARSEITSALRRPGSD